MKWFVIVMIFMTALIVGLFFMFNKSQAQLAQTQIEKEESDWVTIPNALASAGVFSLFNNLFTSAPSTTNGSASVE